jgi:hypothetical protein
MNEQGGNVDTAKAMLLPKSHSKSCDVCMLLDSQAPEGTKWHIYKEGYNEDHDSYVCSHCADGVRDIRKKCHQKVDNPNHKIFENFVPWFAKEVPGMLDNFKEQKA